MKLNNALKKDNFTGKTFAGYQLWFKANENKESGWHHWSNKSAPSKEKKSFELYPDVSEYPKNELHETDFAPLPGGAKSRLFNSKNEETIKIQISWLAAYGIDGVAVQRFYGTTSADYIENENHLKLVGKYCDEYDRAFYVMYDLSGAGRDDENVFERIKSDMLNNIEKKGITAHKSYAYAGGKPVICLWGLASREWPRYPSAQVAKNIINWLKERGYFVIGGIPEDDWTEREDEYLEIYKMLDMISPWTPGRYNIYTAEEWLGAHVKKHLNFCTENNIIYQPVVFPGFAWSTWNVGAPNAYPRMSGEFFWKQVSLLKQAGASIIYLAMFDEYDEGTAYMKAAADYFEIPEDQYFLTLAADGYWLSSDYYLRLAGAAAKLLKSEAPFTNEIPIPHSEGPVFWRNSFEKRYIEYREHGVEGVLNGYFPIDVCLKNPGVYRLENSQILFSDIIKDDAAASGEYCFSYKGRILSGGGRAVYKIAETKIKTEKALILSYNISSNSSLVDAGVDVLFGDGTLLSDSLGSELYLTGNGREQIAVEIPLELSKKGIDAIFVAAKCDSESDFDLLVDDISIVSRG